MTRGSDIALLQVLNEADTLANQEAQIMPRVRAGASIASSLQDLRVRLALFFRRRQHCQQARDTYVGSIPSSVVINSSLCYERDQTYLKKETHSPVKPDVLFLQIILKKDVLARHVGTHL